MEAAITEPAFDELLAVEVTTVDDVSPVGPVGLHEAFRQADNHVMGRLFDVLVGFLNEFVADRMEKLIRSRGSATLGSRLFTDDM